MGDFERFYNKALRFLSFRPRSEKEISDKLKTQKASPVIIEKVISKLKEQKFLNDEEFAKWWIEQRTTFKPRSLRLIKLELRQKGISKEIIESRIINQESRGDLERAKELVKKRIEKFRDLSKKEIYQKLGSYLARRGFDWETIKQAIDESLFKRV
ncbi:MAG: regulatory protein RecX [uncultured bacterium]|nr:MAG: regulatory protein RecX [uncultured bacterium]OGH13798.1 MAG: hypothetical protein A2687_03345 [Candidatus Levybacteria bacterium RIFCSPHIGHO2_01_FULL_38_26]